MRLGSIYIITDKINGYRYIGQTARDVDTRFAEHCQNKKGHSKLHEAIQEKGWQNFRVEVIEKVPIDQLDERERYWIKELGTQAEYNIAPGGKDHVFNEWNRIKVVENGLVFDSKEDMARLFAKITTWSQSFLSQKFKEVLDTGKEFLGYHFVKIEPYAVVSDDDTLEDWIKTVNIKYQGKHVYCTELDMEFETIAEAAKYLLDNNLYVTTSRMPLQSLVTAIGKNIHGKTNCIIGAATNYHFEQVPGTTKQKVNEGGVFQKTPIYCPQLDKTFESQTVAAQYLIDEGIWSGIKLKTARLRISDIVRGVFPDYRGYTFQKIN